MKTNSKLYFQVGEQLEQRSHRGKSLVDLRNEKSLLGKGQSAGDEGQWGNPGASEFGFFPNLLKPLEDFTKEEMMLLVFNKISLWRARLRGVFLHGEEAPGSKNGRRCTVGGYFSKPGERLCCLEFKRWKGRLEGLGDRRLAEGLGEGCEKMQSQGNA